jgi:hypothetical protein
MLHRMYSSPSSSLWCSAKVIQESGSGTSARAALEACRRDTSARIRSHKRFPKTQGLHTGFCQH